MALLNMFKAPKIRKFDHKPIYWDPAKEKREERLERIKQELNNEKDEDGVYKPTIRKGVFQEQRKSSSLNRQTRLIRLILLFALVIALVYWLF